MTAFAPILDRLGKLVPRLGSDQPAEVAATVAAIGRTLRGAGLDFNDLGQRLAEPGIYDGVVKAKRKPPPWPTLATLDRAGRLAWLDAIDEAPLDVDRQMRAAVEGVREAVEAGRDPAGYGVAVFNRLAKACWQAGCGPEVSGAAGLQRETAGR